MPAEPLRTNPPPSANLFRQVVESIVYLSCAVILFRTFAAEGYMISTGSMAPSLLGYHRNVTCAACEYQYAFGASAAQTTSVTASAQAEVLGHLADATCPNCGEATADTRRYPRNEGDQLLVHKHAYTFRAPRRWETVVFRNPANPVEAYVKRVGGLPGETIQIKRGDVIADGKLQRKPLLTQRSMRVLVHDDHYQPSDARWQPRWQIPPDVVRQDGRYDFPAAASMTNRDDRLAGAHTGSIDSRPVDSDSNWRTVSYQHWLRSGGAHETRVSLPYWPADATTVAPNWDELRYNSEQGQLIARGVLDRSWHSRLKKCSTDSNFIAAIDELEAKSHQSPIVDHYGYNRATGERTSYAVRDLMWAGQVRATSGRFRVQLLYGRQPFIATFDLQTSKVKITTLGPNNREDLLAVAACPKSISGDLGALVEMSVFDRQVLVAVNGELVVPPIPFASTELSDQRSKRPASFAVQAVGSGQVTSVANVKLYRDVYVTPKGYAADPEFASGFVVADGEYFVLGDNSPVSVDSRMWDNPAVAHSALIGKPFLVHLPSRQQAVHWSGESRHIRLPDWERVRYVR